MEKIKEQRQQLLSELVSSTCLCCERMTPYKKRYIRIEDGYKFYITDAFCSDCYKYYLEGFPWSENLCNIPYVYSLPKHTRCDVVELY